MGAGTPPLLFWLPTWSFPASLACLRFDFGQRFDRLICFFPLRWPEVTQLFIFLCPPVIKKVSEVGVDPHRSEAKYVSRRMIHPTRVDWWSKPGDLDILDRKRCLSLSCPWLSSGQNRRIHVVYKPCWANGPKTSIFFWSCWYTGTSCCSQSDETVDLNQIKTPQAPNVLVMEQTSKYFQKTSDVFTFQWRLWFSP